MSHRRQPSSISTASCTPALVTPGRPPTRLDVTTESPRSGFVYPIPLPIAALLDLIYSIRRFALYETRQPLLALSILRVVLLGGLVGLSRRWRSRGGWVTLVCGATVGAAVWEGCAGQLKRHSGEGERHPGLSSDDYCLVAAASIAALEHLLFLLLLRLSPPLTRLDSFSFHPSSNAAPTPTRFSSQGEDTPSVDSISPARAGHHRHVSDHTVRSDAASYRDGNTFNLDDGTSASEHEDPDVSDSASSISASSIIDLPPELSPSRIVPPKSLSMNGGLNLAALDNTSVIGPLVRRTRSARFLGRRFSGREAGRTVQDGYGTFGGAA